MFTVWFSYRGRKCAIHIEYFGPHKEFKAGKVINFAEGSILIKDQIFVAYGILWQTETLRNNNRKDITHLISRRTNAQLTRIQCSDIELANEREYGIEKSVIWEICIFVVILIRLLSYTMFASLFLSAGLFAPSFFFHFSDSSYSLSSLLL